MKAEMKNAILELLKTHETETEFEGQAINEVEYDTLADNLIELVELFDKNYYD